MTVRIVRPRIAENRGMELEDTGMTPPSWILMPALNACVDKSQ